jgi:uncharacterized protein (TIGR03437 family)
VGNTRYVFGHWSDDGPQTHTITASSDVKVFTASFIQQFRVTATVTAAGGGSVSFSPDVEDGYYANRSEIELRALPDAGFFFQGWSGTQSGSANPKKVAVAGTNSITAQFTQSTLTTIASDPPGLWVTVDGSSYIMPRNFDWMPGETHNLDAATQTDDLVRYVLNSPVPQVVTATSSPAVHTVNFIKQHMLTTGVSPSWGGTLTVTPPPDQGYVNDGAMVQFTASPRLDWHFDYWSGDLGGYRDSQSLVVRDQTLLTARFAPDSAPAIAARNAASFATGGVAPGEIVAIVGNNLFPQTIVFAQPDASGRFPTELAGVKVTFDGEAAPLIAVQVNTCTAIVPYSVQGKPTTQMQVDYQGAKTALPLWVAAAAPGIFSMDSSGRGQGAILNEDSVTVNSPEHPAARGSVIVIYATGAGQTSPPGQDGRIIPASMGLANYPRPVLPVSVRIGAAPAEILYAGAAPDLVSGAIQVNARVPVNIDVGDHVPVILTVGDQSSLPAITVAVR